MARKRKRRLPRRHRQVVGAEPGTLITPPHSTPTEVRLMRYRGTELIDQVYTAELAPPGEGHGVIWVDVEGLADLAKVQDLGRRFGLNHLAMEDILFSHQPKADDYGDHLQICFLTMPVPSEQAEAISMFVGSDFVLTFQNGHPGDPFEPVRERLRNGRGSIRERGSDYLAYALLDSVIDAYFPLVDSWTDQLLALEEMVLERPSAALWNRLCGLRSQVLTLRRHLRHFREAIARLLSFDSRLIQRDTRPFFRDLHDHLSELVETLEALRESTAELMSTFHARQSQKTNDTMQVLAIISTLFIPLTFVAGVYGMNFNPERSPWNMPELNWTYGYPACLGLMLVILLTEVWLLWRKGWIFQGPEEPPSPSSPGP